MNIKNMWNFQFVEVKISATIENKRTMNYRDDFITTDDIASVQNSHLKNDGNIVINISVYASWRNRNALLRQGSSYECEQTNMEVDQTPCNILNFE